MMENIINKIDIKKFSLIFIIGMGMLFAGCNSDVKENGNGNTNSDAVISENLGETIFNDEMQNDLVIGYEGEWYRTEVPSYDWARMRISNWEGGKSFDVIIDNYGGYVSGNAVFITEDTAVLYDVELKEIGYNEEKYGVYLQFLPNEIIITHDPCIGFVFGGSGVYTAEGTYIQGEPEYTNCTDVSEIFTENELELIQELLGESYETLFENMIELGEIREYEIENGRLWEAYKPPYSAEWCNILIYQDGRIYIEGCTYNGTKEFYTNSENTEMPDIDLLKDGVL